MSAGEIKKAIQILAGQNGTVRIFDAEVKTVNQSDRTCEVIMIGGKSSNTITVRLMASVDDGAYFIPKVGTTVIVTMSDHVEPYVSMYSEVENIIWLGGEYEGVPIVKHPTNTNLGLLKKLNNIENKLNSLISSYNAHTHIYIAGVAPYAAPGTSSAVTTSTVSPPLTTTTQSDIEHPNIKH
jgi:hypothetical protein